MKKILFLLLSTIAMYGQVPADATPLENIQITNNTTDNSATKVNVQSTDGTINTISKSDLVNVVEVNDVPSLPLVGEVGKIYVVKNVNKIYRWNGTFYQELAGSDISGLQAQIDLKAIRNSIDFRGKDIEFFGDSYTSGSGATSTDKRWTSIVSRILGATEINRGVAGTTLMKRTPINYMASPNMVDNVVNIPTKTASKAMLVFAYGLNDMGQTATDYNTTNFKTDYQFVLNNALSKGWLPSQILLIPAYYIGSAGYAAYATITGNAAPTESRHLSFIQATKEIADLNGTMYFDIYQDQKRNNTTLLDPDGIHPNNAGYAYIASDVLQYLGADKIGTTLNTTWDLKAGFIPNNNGSVFYNSLIYDSGARIGIGTISPQSTFHVNSLANTVDLRFTNSVTGSTNLDGTTLTVDLNGDFVINNYENKGIITATNNTIRNYTNNIGQTILGGTTASNTVDRLQVKGSAQATQWIADNGTNGSFFQGKNAGTNLFVIGNDNAIGGGSINDLAYYSYTGIHKFYQSIVADSTIRLKSYTVSTLPIGVQGATAYVTDAVAPTYLGPLVGGGAVKCPVFYNGSAWVSH